MPTSLVQRPVLWLGALLFAWLGTLGCTTFDEQQRRWIFAPEKESFRGRSALPTDTENVWIDFDSRITGRPVRLHALWMPNETEEAPALLYLHGARWDLTGSARRMERMRELGFSVLGIDYRGFGRSSDELPSEALALEDAQAGWRWLEQQALTQPRYLFGHSLGSGVAVQLAGELSDLQGLIVEGSFTSLPDVFSTLKWGWLPLGPFITQRFASGDRIPKLTVPVLVVHGSQDRLIKPELGRALYERVTAPKRFVLVEGGSHHNTNAIGQDQYREALYELFRLGTPPSAPKSPADPAVNDAATPVAEAATDTGRRP